MQELAQGRTSVFVAHRLSTVQQCDKIIVSCSVFSTHLGLLHMHNCVPVPCFDSELHMVAFR